MAGEGESGPLIKTGAGLRRGIQTSRNIPRENQHMTMRERERWICSNPKCRCQVYVMVAAGPTSGTNPRCSCGSAMKKAYSAPSFTRLELSDDLKVVQELFSSGVISR